MVFPLAKLAFLAIRQISKPLANSIKQRAKSSPTFRNYVCIPPATFYHYLDVNVRSRLMNLGKPRQVVKLSESEAVELGADMLGECIIFTVAVGCLYFEYNRQGKNERSKEDLQNDKLLILDQRIKELGISHERLKAQHRELTRVVAALSPARMNDDDLSEHDDHLLDKIKQKNKLNLQKPKRSNSQPALKPTDSSSDQISTASPILTKTVAHAKDTLQGKNSPNS